MQKTNPSPINFGNQQFVLEQLRIYQRDPTLLSSDWVAFFQGMEFAQGGKSSEGLPSNAVEVYRRLGHLVATTNPVALEPLSENPLEVQGDAKEIARLKHLYTGNISYECNVESKEFQDWFYQRIEKSDNRLEAKDYEMILRELWKARYLEEFLQKKFLGAKRFSLEGGESFMPMLFEIFEHALNEGYETGVIGMAHRGRINVLCNLLGKPYQKLFQEFNTKFMPPNALGLGDVKYHKGYVSLFKNTMELHLLSNPSHLESVDPVVLGFAKARKGRVFPLMVHGDASVAGQGVVYESLQCMKLQGYSVSGTVHIVINNQVGFTAVPEESRSTRYCTDVAKAFGIPVIHVTADDPAACVRAARLAFEIKNRFSLDVFIDMNCYRFYGHNESDEPRFTNPILYQKIENRKDVYEEVKQESGLSPDWISAMEAEFKDLLDSEFEKSAIEGSHSLRIPEITHSYVESCVDKNRLEGYMKKISSVPDGFSLHPKIARLFADREKRKVLDWAVAELLAYASLLDENIPVRLSGQDSKRGTFSHRHAVLFDQTNGKTYTPLEHISEGQAPFEVYNSPLSEYAVMGFEFGYSLGNPKALVIWEAQFGDFTNGAQIIVDQYIAGCETKWNIHSGLTLFLPHGYEGMGPEHTSCRLERFLELSALGNWQVVYPTTPAQFFHLLRSQALREEKRPLIVATPKSMLRLPESFSSMEELAVGGFKPVIDDKSPKEKVRKVLLCTGKIYYELCEQRGDKPVAIIRVERLYPFPKEEVLALLQNYPCREAVVWIQEEPKNQGAWSYVHEQLFENENLSYVGRGRIPVPDTGSPVFFHQEQERIISEALR